MGLPTLEGIEVLAFDPGTAGGMFCYIANGVPYFQPLPLAGKRIDYHETHKQILFFLEESTADCVIEDVWVHGDQGAVSGAVFVESYAVVRSLMMAMSYHRRVTLLRPQMWKKVWGLPGKTKDPKASGVFVEQNYPDEAELMVRMSTKVEGRVLNGLDQNKAEAFLLALTPRRLET